MQQASDRPRFHVASPGGWVNDPNGPLLYRGVYHLFYQHLTSSVTWTWGLAWGHAVSDDLVHWRHLPLALQPSPDGFDQDGCFSGCATVDEDGIATILYTGVVRRPDLQPQEGASLTCASLAVERQLLARAFDPDDAELTEWAKLPQPWLEAPPKGLPVNAFRDPFLLERPGPENGGWWRLMIGSAVETVRGDCMSCVGTALVYRSRCLTSGWEYEGPLCRGNPANGVIWECPVLARPPQLRVADGIGAGVLAVLAQQASLPRAGASTPVDESHGQEAVMRSAASTPALTGLSTNNPEAPGETAPGAGAGGVDAVTPARAGRSAAAVSGSAAEAAGVGAGGRQLARLVSWPPSQQQQQRAAAAARRTLRAPGQEGERSALNPPTLPVIPRPASPIRGEPGPAPCEARTPAVPAPGAVSAPPARASSGVALQHAHARPTHFLSASVGVCPPLFWLGSYADGRFDMPSSFGPVPLDLGDIAYAPNLLVDASGRLVMWLWLQEQANPGGPKGYAGCISVPRVLHLHGSHLHQQPLPELAQLRSGLCWRAARQGISPGRSVLLPGAHDTTYLDIELTLAPGSEPLGDAHAAGLLLAPFTPNGHGAALLYHFASCQLVVVVSSDTGAAAVSGDAAPAVLRALSEAAAATLGGSTQFGVADAASSRERTRKMGGRLRCARGEPVQLRVMVDHSIVEVFAGSGEALATRVYRGDAESAPIDSEAEAENGPGCGSGDARMARVCPAGEVWFVALGADAVLVSAEVHGMASIWQ